jgi:WD40 repeat protein
VLYNYLLTGANDKNVFVWDIEKPVEPVLSIANQSGINDVCWSKCHPNVFGTAEEDGHIYLWDRLIKGPIFSANEHEKGVLCMDFSPLSPTFLLTGSDDNTVKFWDTRMMNSSILTFTHEDSVR